MMHRFPLLMVLPLLLAGCDTEDVGLADVQGLVVVASDAGVAASVERLQLAIAEEASVRAVAEVDVPPAGGSVRLVLFSYPHLIAQLLQADPRVGLDLPFGLLVYEAAAGTRVAYDTADYLAWRYRLDGVSQTTLGAVDRTLRTFATTASGGPFRPDTFTRFVSEGEGLVTVPIEDNGPRAYDRLIDSLDVDDALTPLAVVDFERDERETTIDIPYARLVVFDAPALTGSLFGETPTLGADLPLKLLVFQDGEEAFVAYDDPFYLADRHGLEGADAVLAQMRTLLDGLAEAVATAP